MDLALKAVTGRLQTSDWDRGASYVVVSRDPLEMVWVEGLVYGLEGKLVRITVEVLPDE